MKYLKAAALLLMIIAGAACLVIHSYIGKIRYDRGDGDGAGYEAAGALELDETAEAEEENPVSEEEEAVGETDSPETEIAVLEARLKEQTDESAALMFSKDVVNLLLIGCDSRRKGGGGRSDAIILLSINRKSRKITMTSFMRDSYVTIPGYENNRINAAYAYGGAGLLMETIETNFAVETDRYVMVDFYSFADIVDKIGASICRSRTQRLRL